MRQVTHWKFTASYSAGTGIRVGYIHNKVDGVCEDVIRLQCHTLTEQEPLELRMRVDEAVIIAAGLNKVAGQILIGQLKIPKGSVDILKT